MIMSQTNCWLSYLYSNKEGKLGKFTMVYQPIDLGWLVVGSGSFDLLLLETLIDVRLKLHHARPGLGDQKKFLPPFTI